MTPAQLRARNTRRTAKSILIGGLTVSLVINAVSADRTLIGMTTAALAPLMLFASIEMLLRMPAKMPAWKRRVVVGGMGVVVLVAAWISYWHTVHFVQAAGEAGLTPYLYPLIIDVPMLIASVLMTTPPPAPVAAKRKSTTKTATVRNLKAV